MMETVEASLSQRALERGMRSLGTLGSGNHFLELQTVGQVVDEQTASTWGLYENQIVAMIHSGSRGLGHQVCTDHVRQLEASYKLQEGMWHNDTWDYHLPDRQLAAAPVHSKEGQTYLDAMNAAANFAFANRAVLADRLRTVLRLEMGVDGEARTLYDVAHNIAKMETHVVHGKILLVLCPPKRSHSEPLVATTPTLQPIFLRRGSRSSSRGTWATARGSWQAQPKAATAPLVRRATGQEGRFREAKPRRHLTERASNAS